MTYSYRNGQRVSEHNYSVCLKVRELCCPESPCQHYQCSPIMPHSLFHFCLCSEYLCVSRRKNNCICFPVWLFILKSCPGNVSHDVVLSKEALRICKRHRISLDVCFSSPMIINPGTGYSSFPWCFI